MKTLILGGKDLEKILTMDMAIAAVERAFAAHGRGEAVMPPKLYLPLEKFGGDFRAMPALLGDVAGVKWVNMHPENPKRFHLPAVMGVYLLSDPETAFPLAVMDGTRLTAFRTGAAAAVASRHLAVKQPATIGFIGCGTQARSILAAHRALYSGFRAIMADADPGAAETFARESGGFTASLDQAGSCDIICTSTPSRSPVLFRSYVGISTHINAMGADAPGKQELDPRLLHDATVVLDDLAQATESGEVNVPLHAGTYRREQIFGTLGEIVAGRKPGRVGTEITIFDSTGLAIQDLALAQVVFDEARRRGLGIEIDLV
ncbi:MAG TPA: ornithine cyclodeaminase family protein [Planctomycetota bacterium]|nr:ornithine cyclodeaminase family protein [Planctomycetota bacterium]